MHGPIHVVRCINTRDELHSSEDVTLKGCLCSLLTQSTRPDEDEKNETTLCIFSSASTICCDDATIRSLPNAAYPDDDRAFPGATVELALFFNQNNIAGFVFNFLDVFQAFVHYIVVFLLRDA